VLLLLLLRIVLMVLLLLQLLCATERLDCMELEAARPRKNFACR
jgi:hypothetical protein